MSEPAEHIDGLKCPHCGHVNYDAYMYRGDSGKTRCPECSKLIKWSRVINVTYTSEPMHEAWTQCDDCQGAGMVEDVKVGAKDCLTCGGRGGFWSETKGEQ